MNDSDKRGPGAPPGRRPVVWVCAAIVHGKLITEKCIVQDQSPGAELAGTFPKSVAERDFTTKHGTPPEIVLGPFFDKRGGQAAKVAKKRLSVNREDLDKYKIKVERRNAIFGDWKGHSNAIEDEPDLALFIFMTEVNPSDKKRNPPAAGIVNVADLTYID